jgi:hypothetical protein
MVTATLISGCVRFDVRIDSISSEEVGPKKTYVLLPGNQDTAAEDLLFKEFAKYVHRALAAKGFLPAVNVEEAKVVIFLSYGIGNPQEHLYSYTTTESSPVYSTFGGEVGTIKSKTSHVGSFRTYDRFILIDAYDLDAYREQKKLSQLWKTTVTSSGSSGDLRRVFPVLIAASRAYLGSNTGRQVHLSLDEQDRRVLEIKGAEHERVELGRNPNSSEEIRPSSSPAARGEQRQSNNLVITCGSKGMGVDFATGNCINRGNEQVNPYNLYPPFMAPLPPPSPNDTIMRCQGRAPDFVTGQCR